MPSYAGPPVATRPGEVVSTLRLLGYLALAIALIVLDHRGGWLTQARAQADVVTQPIWWLAGLPGRLSTRVKDDAVSRTRLMDENRQLRNELLVANARLTRLSTAAADNVQLRALLGVAETRGLDVQLAPILDIDLDPSRQRLVLDAGSGDGVRMGQPVIDAGGLMGQIIRVTPTHSTVLLLTDPDHAVPVVIARSGVRLIAYGRGRSDQLELADIPLNSEVKVGDVLVTSGLGGRFPAGFPVGTVTALRPDDSHAFLIGDLRPAAQLDRGRDVLLLKSAPPLRMPVILPGTEGAQAGAGVASPAALSVANASSNQAGAGQSANATTATRSTVAQAAIPQRSNTPSAASPTTQPLTQPATQANAPSPSPVQQPTQPPAQEPSR